ncbi:MAG: InlB B-repeat-containing protein [Oscillospiraceae bacterium]|nr:InlB B-repeat-containing protein [Oscillospiraceae bacterium]
MKRFLAAILTISMCLSVAGFVPTVSAADADPTVYDFVANDATLKKTEPIDPRSTPWYSVNTRNWKGFDVSDNIKEFYQEIVTNGTTSWDFDNGVEYTTTDSYANVEEPYNSLDSIRIRILRGQSGGLVFASSVKFGDKKVNNVNLVNVQANFENAWIAIKLDAPSTSGKHELAFNWVETGTGTFAGDCDVFLVPYDGEHNDGDYYIDNFEPVAEGLVLNNATSKTTAVENVYIAEERQHIVIIKLNGKANSNKIFLESITLTPVEDETAAPTEINYGVFDNVEDSDAVTVTGGENNKLFGSVTAGTGISATAGEKEGYTFRYWVLGSAATGRYYSSEKTVTINPYANIALTAIYTEATEDTKYLDFFNWNGEFVDSKEVTDGKVTALPTQPTLTGYSFLNWILEDNKTTFTDATVEIPESISKAMAQYTKVGDYDKPVQNNGSVKGWTRNGELVTYSENYEFFTWLNDVGTIAAYTGEEISDEIPLAVLESDGGENFMLEYDKGAYTIKEAGILFGKTANVNVESAYSKATAKYLEEDGHGQLTAAPEGDADMELYARGYVMYNDKVIYTEAIEVNYNN